MMHLPNFHLGTETGGGAALPEGFTEGSYEHLYGKEINDILGKVKNDTARAIQKSPAVMEAIQQALSQGKRVEIAALNETFQLEEFLYYRDKTKDFDIYKEGADKALEASFAATEKEFQDSVNNDSFTPKGPALNFGRVGLSASPEEIAKYAADPDKASAKAYLEKKANAAGLEAAKVLYKDMEARLNPALESGYPRMLQENEYLRAFSQYLKDNPAIFQSQGERVQKAAQAGDKEQKQTSAAAEQDLVSSLAPQTAHEDAPRDIIQDIAHQGIRTSLLDSLKMLHSEAADPLSAVTEEEFTKLLDALTKADKGLQLLHPRLKASAFKKGEIIRFDEESLRRLQSTAPKLYALLNARWTSFIPEGVQKIEQPIMLGYLFKKDLLRKEDKKFYDNDRAVDLLETLEFRVA